MESFYIFVVAMMVFAILSIPFGEIQTTYANLEAEQNYYGKISEIYDLPPSWNKTVELEHYKAQFNWLFPFWLLSGGAFVAAFLWSMKPALEKFSK